LGEYIQMSTRRGLDDQGVVMMLVDKKLEPVAAKTTVKGGADQLDSTFHLGYNINLMKVGGIGPELLLEIFSSSKDSAGIPQRKVCMANFFHMSIRLQSCTEPMLEEDINEIEIPDEERVAGISPIVRQLTVDFRKVITHSSYSPSWMIDQISEFRLWVGCCHRFPKTLTTEGTRTVLLPAHCLVHLMRSQNWPIPEAVRPPMSSI